MLCLVKEVKGVEVFDNFTNKFIEHDLNRPVLEGNMFKLLSSEEKRYLEFPFEEGEIKYEVWSCEGSKCPGLDGYSLLLIKKCWSFIKNDVVSCFKDFHYGRFFLNQLLRLSWL